MFIIFYLKGFVTLAIFVQFYGWFTALKINCLNRFNCLLNINSSFVFKDFYFWIVFQVYTNEYTFFSCVELSCYVLSNRVLLLYQYFKISCLFINHFFFVFQSFLSRLSITSLSFPNIFFFAYQSLLFHSPIVSFSSINHFLFVNQSILFPLSVITVRIVLPDPE